jgi:hypothetical protein
MAKQNDKKASDRYSQHHESRKPMNRNFSAITASIIFAAAAGLLLAAVVSLPLRPAARITAANSAIFLCVAGYTAFLARLNGRSLKTLFAPLFMLAAVWAAAGSVNAFVVPAAAGLSWVRSGICFPGSTARRLCAEALACPAGLALVWLLQPPGPYGWALGIWMFGLIQALYVVMVDPLRTGLPEPSGGEGLAPSHFRARALLNERKLERAFEELGLS